MLERVPQDNAIMGEYQKQTSSSARPITEEFRKTLEEMNKLKGGGKRKAKDAISEAVKTPKKKVKRAARKPRSLYPV